MPLSVSRDAQILQAALHQGIKFPYMKQYSSEMGSKIVKPEVLESLGIAVSEVRLTSLSAVVVCIAAARTT